MIGIQPKHMSIVKSVSCSGSLSGGAVSGRHDSRRDRFGYFVTIGVRKYHLIPLKTRKKELVLYSVFPRNEASVWILENGAAGASPECGRFPCSLDQEKKAQFSCFDSIALAIITIAGTLIMLAMAPFGAATATEYYLGNEIFAASRYAGRWYEIASLKEGFAGEGQADCHCTQGIYTQVRIPGQSIALQVNTFCVHGSPEGNLSGIQGLVTCASPYDIAVLPEFLTGLEREEKIVEKCSLQFPSIPIIPGEPYDIIRTDYTSFALVRGAKDRSFVQVYSRTPNPGKEFVAARLDELKDLGYPIEKIKITPQDCPEMEPSQMMSMMQKGMKGGVMRSMLANREAVSSPEAALMRGVDLGPVKGVRFEGSRNILKTFKNIVKLRDS